MKYRTQGNRGFTLVEVLVAVGIVGTLAGVVLAGLSEARAKARDKVRLTDMAQIHLALRLYYEANGEYPPNVLPPGVAINPAWFNSLEEALEPVFIDSVPHDPLMESYEPVPNNVDTRKQVYRYDRRGGGQNYILITHLESVKDYPFCYIIAGDWPYPTTGYASPDRQFPDQTSGWPYSQYGRLNLEGKDCRNIMK